MTANQRIFLNVVATYGRSLYALAVGLFCGRWTLMALGEVDYGLYGVVGGLTAFITYFNNIVGGAIGRFYAISVGAQRDNLDVGLERCRSWFTTAVVLNTTVPIVLILIGYPLGIWAIECFLTVPADRINACIWVWRFVCTSCFLGMVTIPYNAMYLAKQYIAELTLYSVATTTLNACCMYYMVTHPGDWLQRFAFWQCLLAILPRIIIAARAHYIFPECRVLRKYLLCWSNIKQLGSFAVWTAWGTLGGILRGQGLAIVTNKFFGPRVNSGYAVGNTLSAHTDTLSSSIIGACSPAIFNAWGAKDYERARRLAYQTCKLGTLCVLLFAVPLALEVDEVLLLWLKTPPQYASGFCLLFLATMLIDRLSVGHQITVNARGKMALYQAFVGTALVLSVPVAAVLVSWGLGVYSIGYAMVLATLGCTLGRVWFARSLAGMSARYWFARILMPLGVLVVVSAAAGLLPRLWMEPSFWRVLITTIMVVPVMVVVAWRLVLDSVDRQFIVDRIGKYIGRER